MNKLQEDFGKLSLTKQQDEWRRKKTKTNYNRFYLESIIWPNNLFVLYIFTCLGTALYNISQYKVIRRETIK